MTTLENRIPLRDKILGSRNLVWSFEVVPPATTEEDVVQKRAEEVFESIGSEIGNIDALLLPDVDNEEVGVNGATWQRKLHTKPREYAELLKKVTEEKKAFVEMVLHRRTVATQANEHEIWLTETANMGYSHLIPVGGDSSERKYVGPNPIEFTKIVCDLNVRGTTTYFLGGICIPTRGMVQRGNRTFTANPTLELRKMLEKEVAGISYHVTQILYETSNLERMFELYKQECERNGQHAKRILLGVTPITGAKNCEFLEWLGVVLPKEVKEYILNGNEAVTERSIKYVIDMLKRFFDKIYRRDNNAKFGVYVESVQQKSLGASVELFGRLRESLISY